IQVPCADGSHVFSGLIAGDSIVRATPLRADGTCFRRSDQSCMNKEAAVTVPPGGRVDVSLVIPRTTGAITMSWTVDGVPATPAVCASKNRGTVEVQVIPVGGAVPTTNFAASCGDGGGTILIPAGLNYQLTGLLQSSTTAVVDRETTAAFFLDYGAAANAPLLAFTLMTCSTQGTLWPTILDVDTTWTKAGSPHHITGVTLMNGAQLTIEAGALVCVGTAGSIQVAADVSDARLDVQGSLIEPVVFRDEPDGTA